METQLSLLFNDNIVAVTFKDLVIIRCWFDIKLLVINFLCYTVLIVLSVYLNAIQTMDSSSLPNLFRVHIIVFLVLFIMHHWKNILLLHIFFFFFKLEGIYIWFGFLRILVGSHICLRLVHLRTLMWWCQILRLVKQILDSLLLVQVSLKLSCRASCLWYSHAHWGWRVGLLIVGLGGVAWVLLSLCISSLRKRWSIYLHISWWFNIRPLHIWCFRRKIALSCYLLNVRRLVGNSSFTTWLGHCLNILLLHEVRVFIGVLMRHNQL